MSQSILIFNIPCVIILSKITKDGTENKFQEFYRLNTFEQRQEERNWNSLGLTICDYEASSKCETTE